MAWGRKLGMAAVALAVVAAIVWGFLPQPILVDTAIATRGHLEVVVREEGRTRVTERYVLSAPVAGYASRVDLEVGDVVERGQATARLEPLPAQSLDPRTRAQARARAAAAEATLESARQEVTAAEAAADLAESELQRIAALFERDAVSAQRRDEAETRARQARARLRGARTAVNVAEHELETARATLRYSAAETGVPEGETVPIRSPVDGRVLSVYHESAGAVAAGEPILEVGNPELLEVEVDVLSADAVKIEPGMEVRLERWGGNGDLDATVRTVEPVGFTKISALGVEEQRVWVIADIVAPRERWSRLGDGYRVEAVFSIWEGDDVLQVASSALFRHDDGWAVFAVEDGVARLRSVSVGRQAGLRTQILTGLEPGDRVVQHPPDELEDGSEVRLAGENPRS